MELTIMIMEHTLIQILGALRWGGGKCRDGPQYSIVDHRACPTNTFWHTVQRLTFECVRTYIFYDKRECCVANNPVTYITWSWNIENIHLYSDITLEKDALSCGIIHFSFKLTKKNLKLLKPLLAPHLELFFKNFYISPKKLHLFLNYPLKN